LWSDGVIVAP